MNVYLKRSCFPSIVFSSNNLSSWLSLYLINSLVQTFESVTSLVLCFCSDHVFYLRNLALTLKLCLPSSFPVSNSLIIIVVSNHSNSDCLVFLLSISIQISNLLFCTFLHFHFSVPAYLFYSVPNFHLSISVCLTFLFFFYLVLVMLWQVSSTV